jgi:hypothetical protein
MAEEHPELVGSAITRILVPQNVTGLLSVTTVPAETLGYDGSLKETLSNLVGCTSADAVDAGDYRLFLNVIRRRSFWSGLARASRTPWTLEYFFDLQESFSRGADVIEDDLAKHALTFQLSPDSSGYLPSSYIPFFPTAKESFRKALTEAELSPDIFSHSLKIFTGFLNASERATAALAGMYTYDIPFGHSPVTTAQQLESIIKSAKAIAVAPLVASTAGVTSAISAGHYVIALDCALTGGAATLIFIGTVAVAELLTRKLAEKRTEKKAKKPNLPPPVAAA